jgi:translation initiation factor 1
MTKDARLVYSSDPAQNKICPKCKELAGACSCEPEKPLSAYKFVANLRIEKQGRGGKTVTVIDQLPKQELFLKELTSELKKKCGAGGTYSLAGKEGLVEIQGDKRDLIRELLKKKAFQVKG